jgi:hypothetical protein
MLSLWIVLDVAQNATPKSGDRFEALLPCDESPRRTPGIDRNHLEMRDPSVITTRVMGIRMMV